MPNTILLGKGDFEQREAVAKAAITPGEHVEYVGSDGTIQAHSTATGAARAAFVTEGRVVDPTVEIGGTWGAGVNAEYVVAQPGMQIYAWLESKGASGAGTIAVGEFLESKGDGSLQQGTTNPVAVALEAVSNTSTTDFARVKVEVL